MDAPHTRSLPQVDNGNCPYAGVLATPVTADGGGGEIRFEHCNGVCGKPGPGQHLYKPGTPDLTDHGETGAIRAACAELGRDGPRAAPPFPPPVVSSVL